MMAGAVQSGLTRCGPRLASWGEPGRRGGCGRCVGSSRGTGRSMVSGSVVRLREVGLRRTRVVERVRGVQSGRARTGDSKHQGQSSRASARKLHPVMIPSTMEFVLCDRPCGAHLQKNLQLCYRPISLQLSDRCSFPDYYDPRIR